MKRAMSDPNQLSDRSSTQRVENQTSTQPVRERSQSVDMKEKKLTRGQMYRNHNNNNNNNSLSTTAGTNPSNRSPVYSRKLPVIPDEGLSHQHHHQPR